MIGLAGIATVSATTDKHVQEPETDTTQEGSPGEEYADPEELFSTVEDIIDDLFDFATTLADPAPHDRIVDPLSTEITPVSNHFDIQHASNKFPLAPAALIQRLGEANCSRRSRLTYFERKQEQKLKQIQKEKINDERSLLTSTVPSTEVESIFDGPRQAGDSGSEASDASATSYAITTVKGGTGPIRVPKPPKSFYEELPFECPYCFTLLSNIRTEKAWK
jgi:hypothetical protein